MKNECIFASDSTPTNDAKRTVITEQVNCRHGKTRVAGKDFNIKLLRRTTKKKTPIKVVTI